MNLIVKIYNFKNNYNKIKFKIFKTFKSTANNFNNKTNKNSP